MKNYYFIVSVFIAMSILCGCGNSDSHTSSTPATSETSELIDKAGLNVPEEFREGAKLVTANDCLTCHKVNDTSIGPSFTSIANRYENIEANASKLLVSVQRGSKGIWGGNTMVPHPNLTPQDGKLMIHYILSNRTTP